MLKKLLLLSCFLPTLAWAEGDALRGKTVAMVRCGPCHHLNTGFIKVGPTLKNIYGKKPTIQGVSFDVWDEAALTAWLINPRAIKANTRMRLPYLSTHDRNDIIAWLKSKQ
ncbi:MAG: c-type cytochrome [Zetaproteobacteria bacterium]|nr:c-type cytochrome [Zetaproteobacteria bacterium]